MCRKSFSGTNKFQEHMRSKTHLNNTKKQDENKLNGIESHIIKKRDENVQTIKDNIAICLFCNYENKNLQENIQHMLNEHNFKIPFADCVKNVNGYIQLIIKKVIDFSACISCDSQNFKSMGSLQNHMIDKQHTYISLEDLDEHLFRFYSLKKLLAIQDKQRRLSKEFKTLKFRLKLEQRIKAKKDQNATKKDKKAESVDEDWEVVEEDDVEENINNKDDSEGEDFEPVTLPNGELLLEDGKM
jgi:hypothetical protein